ncbi:uncharacterized protein OCT59_021701 [Rhizophagus irregularis]|uniref:Uncharacterized protein n=2 Tax=Rhizophagus irregularis TaxID=588596 RepID=A0A915ZJC6_9GLOM|nr:hypothetical protein OCT59_021701 [Rhizophagus irregularis]CAB4490726.1 unnamed protein product [Rhizophagus irregularis]CAB5376561.1 unnamed protein product [Rhizophagus irregularis]
MFTCKIGSKITLKEYNNFLIRKESSGYKYQRKSNGDVYVIDMSDPEISHVTYLLQRYFELANGGVFSNPPIEIHVHPDPTVTGGFIAADVAVAPHLNHVQRPIVPYPGPPPGDKTVFFRDLIC